MGWHVRVILLAAALVAAGQPTQAPADFALETPTGRLAGTLLMPAAARVPVALIIAGSGPTDRDGNSAALAGKNNSYKLLAEALAAGGIATVRYDKRGIAASAIAGLKEIDLRFETYVEDAAAWVMRLRNDARFQSVTVIGHSEGSLIGMLAARAARADAVVSISGVARRAPDVLRDQLRPQLSSPPALWESSESILASLEAGRTVESVPPVLAALYRPSVQPYLISWFRYVPSAEIARLTAPTMIVQGTTDIQVGVAEANALKAARPDASLRIVEGMNHVLKVVDADRAKQIASYTDPALPLAPGLAPAIAAWIRALRLPQHPTGERRSPRALVMADVAGCRIAIEYGRPSKRGRAIWGGLVPWGRWWMPGADEATTLTTSEAIVVDGLAVPAGDYTIYTVPSAEALQLVINRDTWQFHTVYYPDRDLGRLKATITALREPVEQMTFAVERRDGGGVLKLIWDDREYSVRFDVKK
jgi:hypothetical protein